MARALAGDGPSLIECMTYRWREHVGPLWDYDWGYRSKQEVDSWIARCPIRQATDQLVADGDCTLEDVLGWKSAFESEVRHAVADAKRAPFPSVVSILDGTY